MASKHANAPPNPPGGLSKPTLPLLDEWIAPFLDTELEGAHLALMACPVGIFEVDRFKCTPSTVWIHGTKDRIINVLDVGNLRISRGASLINDRTLATITMFLTWMSVTLLPKSEQDLLQRA